jgi:glycosyltransferase involved in cell wall biosynthesis
MPKVSVITPASRGVKNLTHLLRDFKNQTLPKDLFEHVIVWDGTIPEDVQAFMKEHANDYDIKFTSIKKDLGNMSISPGTRPRNYGVSIATGDFVCFCDDDDRYRDTYLESLLTGSNENTIAVVQMSCQESRMYKNGSPNRITCVPEVGLPFFPIICHVGTPCFMVPRKWAVAEPWQAEPEHDFRFIKRIVERFKPQINMIPQMMVDVDGLVLRDLRDWVSHPPFFRGE